MTIYAATIFLSAFLLFQVQPLIAKIILPWFGGSAAVWSAAMLFFQLVLLAGYAYAHISIRTLKPKQQMMVHIGLLLVSCALLPILPSVRWKPTEAGDPTLRILVLLAATIGLPYFLLSSTSPLLQAWYVRRSGSGMPYRLFALSNLGSMLALVSFPFVVEPRLTSKEQAFTWSGVYVLFALLCAGAAWLTRNSIAPVEKPIQEAGDGNPPVTGQRPAFAELFLWVALAACASVLLVSVTTHMSQNIAPIPLLWVLPLALYLMTFILAFESDSVYQRWIFLPLLAPALAGMAYYVWADSGNPEINRLIPVYAIGLFVCCMMCHGELARRKPAAQYLTLFYLMVSLGGAVGGVFVALIAPRIFKTFLELPLGLFVAGTLATIVLWNTKIPKLGAWPLRVVMVLGVGALAGYMVRQEIEDRKGYHLIVRNFYGMLHVRDENFNGAEYRERVLLNGTINHGSQFLDEKHKYDATSYYGPGSGVVRAIRTLQESGPIRVGVIGLGAGVLSNFGRAGDYYRIYEINPNVERIANTEFSFFPHSPADKAILMGDARLTMEKQPSQQYDLIAVDAFTSDSIPIHLLTLESLKLYFTQLNPHGILALHVSNRYLNLIPIAAMGAETLGKKAIVVDDEATDASYLSSSTWVLLSADDSWFKHSLFQQSDVAPAVAPKGLRPWTDDYSNVFQILKL